MPSASVKQDENGSQDGCDPLQKVITLVERKIRNLEKRKNKLEQYKFDLDGGKVLIDDQMQAVQAYDAVIAALELCREFNGQFLQLITDNNKIVKKQVKKEQQEKVHEVCEKTKDILKIQAVLQRMGSPDVRTDFLAGKNGAICLTADNLAQLDQLYKLVSPSLDDLPESQAFEECLTQSTEHMLSLLEGKTKDVANTTYKDLNVLIQEIAACPYPTESTTDAEVPVFIQEKTESEYTNGLEDTADASSENTIPKVDPIATTTTEEGQSLTDVSQSPSSAPPALDTPKPDLALPEPSFECVIAATAPEGPPPGLAPHHRSASPIQQDCTSAPPQEVMVTAMAQLVSPQPPAASHVPPPGQSFFTQPPQPAQIALDLNELVTPGNFNFLQESQVAQDPHTVYMDPAVVSLGAVKPDSLVQLHEQQQQQQQLLQQTQQPYPHQQSLPPPPQQTTNLCEPPQQSNIPTQTYTNQTFSNTTPSGYSQSMPSYPSNSVGSPETNNSSSTLSQTQEKLGFVSETSNCVEQNDVTPVEDNQWGTADGEVEEKWRNVSDSKWDTNENSTTGTWDNDFDDKGTNDMDRKGGYNNGVNNKDSGMGNRGRGGRGNGRGFRGGRGGYGFQNGGGARGGGYHNGGGYRGGRMTSGFRNGRGGQRGNGGIMGPRGGVSGGGYRGRGGNGTYSSGPRPNYTQSTTQQQ